MVALPFAILALIHVGAVETHFELGVSAYGGVAPAMAAPAVQETFCDCGMSDADRLEFNAYVTTPRTAYATSFDLIGALLLGPLRTEFGVGGNLYRGVSVAAQLDWRLGAPGLIEGDAVSVAASVRTPTLYRGPLFFVTAGAPNFAYGGGLRYATPIGADLVAAVSCVAHAVKIGGAGLHAFELERFPFAPGDGVRFVEPIWRVSLGLTVAVFYRFW